MRPDAWSALLTLGKPTSLGLPEVRSMVQACVHARSLSHVRLSAPPWTVAHQAPLPMEYSRQEYWSGLPFAPPGDLPDSGIKPASPAWRGRFSASEPPAKPYSMMMGIYLVLQSKTCFNDYILSEGQVHLLQDQNLPAY